MYDPFPANTQEIVERWDQIGLLDGVEGYRKTLIALYFDEAARYVLHHNLENSSFADYIFPIIRRLMGDPRTSLDIPKLISQVHYFEEDVLPVRAAALHGEGEPDPEAAAVAEFCGNYSISMFGRLRQVKI
jgi:hypothetical protein